MAAPLIYPRFIGRLGNNIWQVACCIGYAKKHGVKWGIKKGYIEKGFDANQVDRFLPHLPACIQSYKVYKEWQEKWNGFEFNYHEIPFHPAGVEILGFFQSWKYFEGAEHEVRKWLSPDLVQGFEDYVSIHVRRGDYVQHSGSFPPVNLTYIDKALDHIYQYTDCRKAIVFSDDIEWCKENLPGVANEFSLSYSEGNNEWQDLGLMASCGHNIIANSSFSWWAGWFNRNPNKVVISPSHKRGNWFGLEAGIKHDVVDLLPPSWVQIEFR